MSWKTKEGVVMPVKDMEISHVEKVLHMLIKKYTIYCLRRGGRYAPQIGLDKMTDEQKRQLLIATCQDRNYLKMKIMRDCFGPPEFDKLMLAMLSSDESE